LPPPQPDDPLERRRNVYRNQTYSMRVGSNRAAGIAALGGGSLYSFGPCVALRSYCTAVNSILLRPGNRYGPRGRRPPPLPPPQPDDPLERRRNVYRFGPCVALRSYCTAVNSILPIVLSARSSQKYVSSGYTAHEGDVLHPCRHHSQTTRSSAGAMSIATKHTRCESGNCCARGRELV
jgi:hypothetical protein